MGFPICKLRISIGADLEYSNHKLQKPVPDPKEGVGTGFSLKWMLRISSEPLFQERC